MPYEVRKQDNKFCVFKQGDNKPLGCHPTQKDAIKQRVAIEIREKERKL